MFDHPSRGQGEERVEIRFDATFTVSVNRVCGAPAVPLAPPTPVRSRPRPLTTTGDCSCAAFTFRQSRSASRQRERVIETLLSAYLILPLSAVRFIIRCFTSFLFSHALYIHYINIYISLRLFSYTHTRSVCCVLCARKSARVLGESP